MSELSILVNSYAPTSRDAFQSIIAEFRAMLRVELVKEKIARYPRHSSSSHRMNECRSKVLTGRAPDVQNCRLLVVENALLYEKSMKPVIFAVLTVAMLALASPVGATMLGMSASHANHATGPPSTPGCVAAFAAHPGTLPDQASANATAALAARSTHCPPAAA